MTYFWRAAALAGCIAATSQNAHAQRLSAKLAEIAARPELVHASFGVAAYDLDAKRMVFEFNAEQLFTPGSTTKLLTAGTALASLGADYRFRTPVYRVGNVDPDGVLQGDLVLVGRGDPNLSGRASGDTLAFTNEDHSYAGGGDSVAKALGDPLAAMRDLAEQIAAAGIKTVGGRVLVDVTLFPQGERELGTNVVISPVILNDNVVDLLLSPGANPGDAITARVSPDLGMFTLVNEVTTGAARSASGVRRFLMRDSTGKLTVRLTGSYAADAKPIVMSVSVDDPAAYAARALVAALHDRGITVRGGTGTSTVDVAQLTGATKIAEHVSLPLSEEIKVMLKVSQNLHASAMPYIVGAYVGHTTGRGALQAGFDVEREFLTKAGLDLIAASQGDGAGGAASAFFSPSFMAHYLAYMATRSDTAVFRRALPILGRDGTLWNIQPETPAAGKVFAKTGTFSVRDPLNRRTIVTGKGLAGYMTTSSGHRLAFAIYANRIPFPPDYRGDAALLVGQALGEIAVAMWGETSR